MGLILLIILVLLLLGAVPTWPYSRAWGYGPSGLLGLLLIILVILMVLQLVPWGFGPYPHTVYTP
jgi:energy-coupling factor transporter transmembrane protein EcfT